MCDILSDTMMLKLPLICQEIPISMPVTSLQIPLETHRIDHSSPYIFGYQFLASEKLHVMLLQKANEYFSFPDQ